MTQRYRTTCLGSTIRVVDCADHDPWCAPDVCLVGDVHKEHAEVVWARARAIANALNRSPQPEGTSCISPDSAPSSVPAS